MTHTGSIFLSCLESYKSGLWMSFQLEASKVRMYKDNCSLPLTFKQEDQTDCFLFGGKKKKRERRKRPQDHILFYVFHFQNSVFKFFRCPEVPNGIKRNMMRKKLPEVNVQWNMVLSSRPKCLLMVMYCSLVILLQHLCAREHFLSFLGHFITMDYYYFFKGTGASLIFNV